MSDESECKKFGGRHRIRNATGRHTPSRDGGRSVLLAILPWFSGSKPRTLLFAYRFYRGQLILNRPFFIIASVNIG